MYVQQVLILDKLSLEAHVRENDRPLLARKTEGVLKRHLALLHKVGDDAGWAAGDSSVAVDENASPADTFFYKHNSCREMSQKSALWSVSNADAFVFEVFGEEGL